MLIPNGFFEYIYHVGSHLNGHPVIDSGLIAGGRNANKERHTVFFTAVDPLKANLHEQREFDLTKPRVAVYKQNRRVHQNSVYWINLELAQRKGLTFYQRRSNGIFLCDTLPSFCIDKVVSTKSEEIFHDKVYESPRPVSMITLKDDWQRERRHNAAARGISTKLSQPIQESCAPGTGKPFALNEGDHSPKTDFRIQGLPHSSVEEADHSRRKKVK